MAPPLLPRGAALLLLLRSAARRPAAASSRGFLSSAAAGGREGALAAAAVAVVGSGLGLWLVPPSLADSGEAVADAPAVQISVGSGSGAVGAVEERGRKRRFLLGGELRFCFLSPLRDLLPASRLISRLFSWSASDRFARRRRRRRCPVMLVSFTSLLSFTDALSCSLISLP